MARFDLEGRVLVVTGASSGIGRATAMAAAAAGMRVVLGARRIDRLADIAGKIQKHGGEALAVPCDVAASEQVEALFEAAMTGFGRVDVAFANAGYGIYAPVLATADEQMRNLFEVNYYGTLRTVHAAVACIRRSERLPNHHRGQILICSSSVSEIAMPNYGGYCATKAAQDSIAGALRAELRRERIHVASVHPGGTSSEFFEAVRLTSDLKATPFNTPKIFRQTPEKVAAVIVRAMRRPRPEVWPFPLARFGLGMATMFPRMSLMIHRRLEREMAPRQ